MDEKEANTEIASYFSRLKKEGKINQSLDENKTIYFEGGQLNFSLERSESKDGGSVSRVRSFEGKVVQAKEIKNASVATREGEKNIGGKILEITLDSKEHRGTLLIFYIRPDEKGWIDVDINMRKKENKDAGALLIR